MTDWLQHHHHNRCDKKHPYPTADMADRKAEKASRKTGELILSYKCMDCGCWHIGHADPTQIAARNLVRGSQLTFCTMCDHPIPADRLARARECGFVTTTCSQRCARKAKQKRRDHRRRKRRRRKPPPSPPVS